MIPDEGCVHDRNRSHTARREAAVTVEDQFQLHRYCCGTMMIMMDDDDGDV